MAHTLYSWKSTKSYYYMLFFKFCGNNYDLWPATLVFVK